VKKQLNEKQLIKLLNNLGKKDIAIKLRHGLIFPEGTKKKVELYYMSHLHERVISGEYEAFQNDGKFYIKLEILRLFVYEVVIPPNTDSELVNTSEVTNYTIECDPRQLP
jgi:hypothetical protein